MSVNRGRRISRYLFNVFFVIQIIDPELSAFMKHRLFRLIILLDNFQLRLKFLIQKHPPHLGRVGMMLGDPDDEIIHRLIVMGAWLSHGLGMYHKEGQYCRHDLSRR